jgi:hypothetical protein
MTAYSFSVYFTLYIFYVNSQLIMPIMSKSAGAITKEFLEATSDHLS